MQGPQRPSPTVAAQGSRISPSQPVGDLVPLNLAIAWQTDDGIPSKERQPSAASAQITVQMMPSSLLAGTQLY